MTETDGGVREDTYMNNERKAFYRGMLAALHVVKNHDQRVLFDEIVESADVTELVAVAIEDEQMEMSGLIKYEYGKTSWASNGIGRKSVRGAHTIVAVSCGVDGCDEPATGDHPYCKLHQMRYERHGDPTIVLKRGRKKRVV